MQNLTDLAVTPIFLPVTSSYELVPQGLIAPELKKEARTEHDKVSELEEIFEEWAQHISNNSETNITESKQYSLAVELTKNTKYSLNEIYAFLMNNQKRHKDYIVGILVSALYNKINDKVIVYDLKLEFPLSYIGYNLPKDRILVINENVDRDLGEKAEGIVIVAGNAKTGQFTGSDSNNLTIFTGNCKIAGNIGFNSKGTIIAGENSKLESLIDTSAVNYFIVGKAKIDIPLKGEQEKRYHNLRKQNPNVGAKLNNYLISLNKMFTGNSSDIARNSKVLGDNPANRIRQDIKEILNEGDYECLI